jgi:hypothetical protein
LLKREGVFDEHLEAKEIQDAAVSDAEENIKHDDDDLKGWKTWEERNVVPISLQSKGIHWIQREENMKIKTQTLQQNHNRR